MTKRMIIMLVLVALLFGGVIGFQQFKAKMMAQYFASQGMPPATVSAMQASYQDWPSELHAIGTLRAAQAVMLVSERAGTVEEVHVQSGDEVKKGQLLLVLDSDEERAQLSMAEAALRLAKLNVRRDQAQIKVNAIAQAQLDQDLADVQGKQAQVEQLQAVLAKLKIRAPFAGRIGVSLLSVGQYLQAGEKIASLQSVNPMRIDFNIPQKQLASLSVGQSVSVRSNSYEGQTFSGRIRAIDNSVDINTRNVQVEAELENEKGELMSGMFVEVAIRTGESRRYLTLPQTAISYNTYGATLFLAKAGTATSDGKAAMPIAEQIFIKTGDVRGDQVAILSGLEAGAEVVTSGQMKLKNGTPLIINNSHPPANDAAPTPQEQ